MHSSSTAEEVARLWNEEKLSLSLIGQRLGITRSAAGGLVYRIRQKGGELEHRPNSFVGIKPRPREKKAIIALQKLPEPVVRPTRPNSTPVSLMAHEEWMCKAVNDNLLYCSNPRVGRSSFCGSCAQGLYFRKS
jgi:hypothetical protein